VTKSTGGWVSGWEKMANTYSFLGLFDTGFYCSTLGIKVDERIDLIFTKYLDILLRIEFLWPCRKISSEKVGWKSEGD
jgi:hypothetical protein